MIYTQFLISLLIFPLLNLLNLYTSQTISQKSASGIHVNPRYGPGELYTRKPTSKSQRVLAEVQSMNIFYTSQSQLALSSWKGILLNKKKKGKKRKKRQPFIVSQVNLIVFVTVLFIGSFSLKKYSMIDHKNI